MICPCWPGRDESHQLDSHQLDKRTWAPSPAFSVRLRWWVSQGFARQAPRSLPRQPHTAWVLRSSQGDPLNCSLTPLICAPEVKLSPALHLAGTVRGKHLSLCCHCRRHHLHSPQNLTAPQIHRQEKLWGRGRSEGESARPPPPTHTLLPPFWWW